MPPLDWNTIAVATPPAFIAAAAGMVEAVMTMEVVNDLTETNNPRPNQQLFALSVGNFVSGLLGTMGGGATVRAAGASHSVTFTCHLALSLQAR